MQNTYLVHELHNHQLQNVVEALNLNKWRENEMRACHIEVSNLIDALDQVLKRTVLVDGDQHDEGVALAGGVLKAS